MQTQLININVVDGGVTPPIDPDIPNTAGGFINQTGQFVQNNPMLFIAIVLSLIILIAGIIYFVKKRTQAKTALPTLFILMLLPILAIVGFSNVNAASTIAPLAPINLTVARDAKTSVTNTSTHHVAVTTNNETGWTLSGYLTDSLPTGITLTVDGNTLTTNSASPTELHEDTSGEEEGTFQYQLVVTVAPNTALGQHTININYAVTDNEPGLPSVFACSDLYGDFLGNLGDIRNITAQDIPNVGDTAIAIDTRNNQPYCIGKLADGNIWMLTNLKLGSITSPMNLTPADTNITSNWTLPALTTSDDPKYSTWGDEDFSEPFVYGPVIQDEDRCVGYDTGAGPEPTDQATCEDDPYWGYWQGAFDYDAEDPSSEYFAGFFYNWCAATAGGTASGGSNTCPEFDTDTWTGDFPDNSTGDICPANWRLPTMIDDSTTQQDVWDDWLNNVVGNTANEFSNLNALMGGFANNQDPAYLEIYDIWDDAAIAELTANWHPNGPFHGVFSGGWSEGFVYQGVIGAFWSGSRYPANPYYAFSAGFDSFYIDPYGYGYRNAGVPVRCLL